MDTNKDVSAGDLGSDVTETDDQEMETASETKATAAHQDDQEMEEASPQPDTDIIQNAHGAERGESYSPIRTTSGEIDQFDLDGGLLDGALDDYDDLDQDTEDTEVGNGEGDDDFSGDDDDDDDDDDDGGIGENEEEGEPDDSNNRLRKQDKILSPGFAHASHSTNHIKTSTQSLARPADPVHSEDSDSDVHMEGSYADEEEDDRDGEAEEEEDHEEEEEEEDESEQKPTPKKSGAISQKPILNRPSSSVVDDLKDSGDDLSDLSEFDDTDDSDEEEALQRASSPQDAISPPLSGTVVAEPDEIVSEIATVGNSSKISGNRKRSSLGILQEGENHFLAAAEDTASKKADQHLEIPGGRSRQIETSLRGRKASMTADIKRVESVTEPLEPLEDEDEEEDEEEEEEVDEKVTEVTADEIGELGDEEEDVETIQMHKDALDALTSIEVEFANLRDKMYEERMTELDKEVEMINSGTHPELSSLMQEIVQKREQRLAVADMGKKHKTTIAQHQFDVTEYQAYCTFQSSRRNTRVELLRELGRKQRQMMLELVLPSDILKRKASVDRPALVRHRKHRKMEAAELQAIKERRGFPDIIKLSMIGASEIDDDFLAMGLSRAPQQLSTSKQGSTPLPPSGNPSPSSIPLATMQIPPSQRKPSGGWPGSITNPPANHTSGSYQHTHVDSKPKIEIYVDGNRCLIDGIWYKPGDAVVVLDAAIGKYNAKYMYLTNDEIMLQRTDGSKTKLHLGLFRGRKLCMQPKS